MIKKKKVIKAKKIKKVLTKAELKKQRNEEFKKEQEKFRKDINESDFFVPDYVKTWKSRRMSWFGINYVNYNIPNKHYEVPIPTLSKTELMRAKQVGVIFTKEQREVILQWMELTRIIYNITVYYFKHYKIESMKSIRNTIKGLYNTKLKQAIIDSNLPNHIEDNAINDVIKAYNSTFALLKLKMIKHFRIRYKKKSNPKKTIVIEPEDFNTTNSFYNTSLNKNVIDQIKDKRLLKSKKEELYNYKTTEPITKKDIKHASRLSYNELNDKFTLMIPIDRKEICLKPIKVSCGIDMGLITLATIYNEQGECYKIGNRKIDARKYKKKFNDENDKVKDNKLYYLTKQKMKAKKLIFEYNKSKFKRFFKRVSRKMQNLTKEMHYKTALFICKNFDNIYLGKLSTKSIVSKKNNLSPLEKEFAYALGQDKFRTIIKNKAEEYGRSLFVVKENMTSKTCGVCGLINDVGSSRIYNCKHCKSKFDRDLNAARNIIIKNKH